MTAKNDATVKDTRHEEMVESVRERYGKIAREEEGSCCDPTCCTEAAPAPSERLGYGAEVAGIPEGADLGLGCGPRCSSSSSR